MANPILKIKRGLSKPVDYLETINQSGVVTQTLGLTAGELGVNLTAGNYSFYIGNNLGKAITFGCEVTTATDLGGVASSDYKIPTQKALKTYVDTSVTSSTALGVMSRYASTTEVLTLTTAAPEGTHLFGSTDFAATTPSTLTYGSGIFTNTSTSTMYLLITYQITWNGFTTTQSYNSRNIVRSAWIQKSFTGSGAADNVYGFTSLLCPPLASNAAGAISGTQNGTAIIALDAGQSFSIRCKNHGSATATTLTTAFITNTAPTPVTNFTKATNIQIVKL
jgi:hypothetical protein